VNKEWHGVPVSPGIAIGKLYCYRPRKLVIENKTIAPELVQEELEKFETALAACRESLQRTRAHAEDISGRSIAKIFEAQLLLLEDNFFLDEMRTSIKTTYTSAETAIYNSMHRAIGILMQGSGQVFRERASDLRDLGRRLIGYVRGEASARLELTEPSILAAEELTPSELIHLERNHLLGVALDEGGQTSHSAILARVFGVPSIVGLKSFSTENNSGTLVIINGNSGKLIVEPDVPKVQKYTKKIQAHTNYRQQLLNIRDSEAITKDGCRIYLHANIELPIEVKSVQEVNADGIGLFRTEYLYLSQESLPDEEEQYEAYHTVAEALAPKPVVIRTFDLGGDKVAADLMPHREPNPFMGWRAIRVSLDRLDIFRTQLRAIARAATVGNVEIMFPMINGMTDLRAAKKQLHEACTSLKKQGIPHRSNLPVGVMIEVPSAAMLVDLIATETDFMSIGTNDLTQFTLAVDRSNPLVADLYQPFHLSVLRLVQSIVQTGAAANKKVSLCGELGGNSIATVLLIGMGLRNFSMSPLLIPEIKSVVRATTLEECKQIAQDVMKMSTYEEITHFLKVTIRKRFADLPVWFGR